MEVDCQETSHLYRDVQIIGANPVGYDIINPNGAGRYNVPTLLSGGYFSIFYIGRGGGPKYHRKIF